MSKPENKNGATPPGPYAARLISLLNAEQQKVDQEWVTFWREQYKKLLEFYGERHPKELDEFLKG